MTNPAQATVEGTRARSRLVQMIFGYRSTAVVHVAATLGVADLISDGERGCEELAADTETHPQSLLRLLHGLASLGVVEETAPGRFKLTQLGDALRADVPQSVKTVATRMGDEQSMRTWGNLLHTIKTGQTTFDHVWGMGSFEFFARHPEISAGFNQAMVEGTRAAMPAVLAAYDFSRFGTVVDVGGGSGALIAAVLQAHPKVRGVVFDTASGSDYAPRLLENAGVADRCEVVTGDFFVDALPAGCDAYVLKSIIHDWDDERSTAILKNCRRAIADGGRLIVVEPVMSDRVTTSDRDRSVVSSDLNMLVNTGGRERTETEFRELLVGAGFRLEAIYPTDAPYPLDVIEGGAGLSHN